MENVNIKDKAVAGVIGLLLLLAGFGGSQYLTPDQVDNTYICPLNDNIGVFHRLSASGKTGYYYDKYDEVGVACRIGRVYEPWILLKKYAEEHGVNLIEPEEIGYKILGTRVYNCTPGIPCIEKKI